ncbi:uncharacterized protein LOC136036498 [Artemia franciscana]|uniref:Uncharacterized protein n=1 Tax=Artemia franciscana TaxID=6661 RepID=A0AA88I6B7_ARTSF|nr:hypothetical protein QYM36_004550 [Artemia franciscana]
MVQFTNSLILVFFCILAWFDSASSAGSPPSEDFKDIKLADDIESGTFKISSAEAQDSISPPESSAAQVTAPEKELLKNPLFSCIFNDENTLTVEGAREVAANAMNQIRRMMASLRMYIAEATANEQPPNKKQKRSAEVQTSEYLAPYAMPNSFEGKARNGEGSNRRRPGPHRFNRDNTSLGEENSSVRRTRRRPGPHRFNRNETIPGGSSQFVRSNFTSPMTNRTNSTVPAMKLPGSPSTVIRKKTSEASPAKPLTDSNKNQEIAKDDTERFGYKKTKSF